MADLNPFQRQKFADAFTHPKDALYDASRPFRRYVAAHQSSRDFRDRLARGQTLTEQEMAIIKAKSDWSRSADRMSFLLADIWDGRIKDMERGTTIAASRLKDLCDGRAEPSRDDVRLICTRVKKINRQWLETGRGHPYGKPAGTLADLAAALPPATPPDPTPATATPPPPRLSDRQARFAKLLADVYSGSTADFSAAAGRQLGPGYIADVAAGFTEPADSDLMLLAEHAGVSLDWLLSGDGLMMFAPIEPAVEPEPAPEPALPLAALQELEESLTTRIDRVAAQLEGRATHAAVADALREAKGLVEDVRRLAQAAGDKAEASTRKADAAITSAAEAAKNAYKASQRTLASPAATREADISAVLRSDELAVEIRHIVYTSMEDKLSQNVAEAVNAVVDRKFSAAAAGVDAIAAATKRSVEEIRRDIEKMVKTHFTEQDRGVAASIERQVKAGVAAALASIRDAIAKLDDRVDELVESDVQGEMARKYAELARRLDAIEAGRAVAQPSASPQVGPEADLAPQRTMTPHEWLRHPGPYQPFLAATGSRRTMAKRLVKVLHHHNLAVPVGYDDDEPERCEFPVADLRRYGRWMQLRQGKSHNLDSWFASWAEQGGLADRQRPARPTRLVGGG